MAGQGITVSILAKIEGWLDLIKLIQNAMKNIKPGTDISKGLAKDLQQVIDMVNNLGKNMHQRLTSDSLITSFVDKIVLVEEVFNRLGTSMSHISFGDIKPEYITAGFKDLLSVLEQANNALGQGMESSFLNAIASSKTLLKEFERMKIDPTSMNIDAIREALAERGKSLEKEVNDGLKKLTDFEKGLEKLKHTRDELVARDKFLGKDASATAQSLLIGHLLPTKGTILDSDELEKQLNFFRSNLLRAGFTPTQLGRIIPDLETVMKAGHWDELPSKFAEYLREAQIRTKNSLVKASEDYKQAVLLHRTMVGALNRLSSLRFLNTLALNEVTSILSGTVQNETKSLRDIVNNIKQQLHLAVTSGFTGLGSKLFSSSLQGIQDASAAMKDYSAALDQVRAKELAVNKVLGVVLRYFSIYAAVRMVSRGIRSMMNNIKELDKTITEIAIVTKMDLEDLWGLMPLYTKLAKNYAASISGVYKVSQLYYQQGLGQLDVMALTELTLKMARISGLDYAEATDYMTNAVRSFKMEMTDAATVVDVYSAVAASSASSVTELATAMSKTASSAAAVGSSFENTTAMLAVMIEATRESPENIGSAMKSIISRYGELKENKTGIDEEGEAYSLNKVDKALLTVGISIHDANGEFRDFDDVIFELAEKWNTIDKNTLRYIATVMAGNRQQSRFLALVSSTERLKEESEKAANSEDASQLQFLKTMDSIEAKTQLFQTSLLSLYTSSGLEKLYKGLLDFGNEFANTLENISGKSGLAGAISNVGASFVTMATLATTAFSSIKRHFTSTLMKMTTEAQNTVALETINKNLTRINVLRASETPHSMFENGEIKDNPEYLTELKELSELEAENARLLLENKLRSNLLIANLRANKTVNQKIGWGMAASAAGMALSAWANTIDINEDRNLKGGLTMGSSALLGLGTGLMIGATAGGPIGALVGVLTGLPGVLLGLGMFTESTAERVLKLEKNIKEASNEKIKSKDELKTLEDYKKKYDELSKSLYESVEKKKEFLELSNTIAATYPQLVKSMDAEGNYILNMTEGYLKLAEAKREAYASDIAENAGKEVAGLKDTDYVLKNIFGQELMASNKILGLENIDQIDDLFKIDYLQDDDVIRSLVRDKLNYGAISFIDERGGNTAARLFHSNEKDIIGNLIFPNYSSDEVTDIYMAFLDQIKQNVDLATAKANLSSLFGDKYAELIDNFDTDFYNQLKLRFLLPEYLETLATNTISTYGTEMINLFSSSLEDNFDIESSDVQKRFIHEQLMDEWQTYYDEHIDALESGELSWDDAVKNFFSTHLQTWYKLLLESELINSLSDEANELYLNMGLHTSADIRNLFPEEELTELQLKQLEWLYKIFNTDFEDILKSYTDWLDSEEVYSLGVLDFSEVFGPEYLKQILSLYIDIIKSNLSDTQKRALIASLNNLYDTVETNKELSSTLKNGIIQKMISGELTTVTGINEVINYVQDLDLGPVGESIISGLKELESVLNVNLATEFSNFSNNIVEQSLNFEKAISNATKGMDLKTATEMAEKMGKTLKDFSYRDGKYYYEDLSDIEDAYLTYDDQLLESLTKKKDDTIKMLLDFSLTMPAAQFDASRMNDTEYLKEWQAELEKAGYSIKDGKIFGEHLVSSTTEWFNIFKTSLEGYLEDWDLQLQSVGLSAEKYKEIFATGDPDKIREELTYKVLGLNRIIEDVELAPISDIDATTLKTLSKEESFDIELIIQDYGNDVEEVVKAINSDEFAIPENIDKASLIGYVRAFMSRTGDDLNLGWNEWIEQYLNEIYEVNKTVIDEYRKDLKARTYLSNGDIKGFVNTIRGTKSEDYLKYYEEALAQGIDESGANYIAKMLVESAQRWNKENEQIIDAIASGDASKLSTEDQEKYGKLIRDTYKNISSSFIDAIFTAMDGGTTALEVTKINQKYLQDIKAAHPEWITGDIQAGKQIELAVDLIAADEEELWKLIQNSYDNEKDRLEAFKNYHNKKFSKNKISSLLAITDNEITYDDFIDYLTTNRGWSTEQLFTQGRLASETKAYGLAMTATGDYVVENWGQYIALLQSDLNYLLKEGIMSDGKKATILDINKARAMVATALRGQETAIKTATSDILNNYQDISIELQEALANALGLDSINLQKLYKTSTNGKTYLDIVAFTDMLDLLPKETLGLFTDILVEITDDYLNNISDAASLTISGAKSQKDIDNFKKLAERVGLEISDMAFSYNDILLAWTLDPAVLKSFVLAQGQLLIDAGLLSLDEVTKYVNDNVTKVLVDAIDIKSFLEAENKSGKARAILAKLLTNAGIDGREINGIIDTLIKGGSDAVSIMLAIAEIAGKELTSSEIEAAYRALVAQLESAVEQLEYGVGSLISGDAIAILDAADYDLVKLDENNYVIKSLGDISKAYTEYYDRLSRSNEATLEALNEAKAKVEETKDGRYKEQSAIDALGDAAGMTYTSFAAILSDAGIKMTDDIIRDYTESLGGNKMRIKDFAAFARVMKWDYNSEEYTSAFKSYNDALIERNTLVKDQITEELLGLKEFKSGDWLNLTYTEKLLKKYSKKLADKEILLMVHNGASTALIAAKLAELTEDNFFSLLLETLANYGAYFDDGILKTVEGANIPGIFEILLLKLSEAADDIEIDTAEILDALSELLSGFIDAIINGIKGGLGHKDAKDLIKLAQGFGVLLTDTDFTETADGLKLSTKAATNLYYLVSKVNAIKGRLIFDELNDSLKESDSRFKDITSIMSLIQLLTNEINELLALGDGGAADERVAAAERELALAKEIAAVRLTTRDDESFHIKGKNTLAISTSNAMSYLGDVADIAEKAETWKTLGYVSSSDIADLSDYVTHLIERGDETGEGSLFYGVQFGGKGGITKSKFQAAISKAFKSVTDQNGKSLLAFDNDVFLKELGMDLGLGFEGFRLSENTIQGFMTETGDFYKAYGGIFADMDYLSKSRKFGEFTGIEDLIDANGRWNLEGKSDAFKESLLASAEHIKIGGKTLAEAIKNNELADDNSRKAVQDLITLAETTDWELESGYETIKEHMLRYGIEEEIDFGDFTYKMEGDHLLIKDNKTGKYITSDGTKCNSAEEALKHMNELDIDDLTKELGYYQGQYESSGQANIALDGVEYTITINPSTGKIVLTSESGKNALDGKEFSDTEEIMKAGYANYLEKFMRERNYGNIEKEIPISEAAWRLSLRNQDVLPAAYTKGQGLSESSRAAFLKAGFNTWKDIQNEWNSMVETYGKEGASLEWEAKYHTRFVPDNEGKMSDDLAKSYIDAVNLSLAAADVAAGIDAAFKNESVLQSFGDAITKGLKESLKSEELIEIEAPEIVIKPSKITIETDGIKAEVNGEIQTGEAETNIPERPAGMPSDVYEHYTEYMTSLLPVVELNIPTETMAIQRVLVVYEPGDLPETPQEQVTAEINYELGDTPEGVVAEDGTANINYSEGDKPQNVTAPDGHGKINYTVGTVDIPSPIGTGTINYKVGSVEKPAEATGNFSYAYGNAFAGGTLMGELGPELVVSKGRYFVVGQSGPEMVDLADDAIVFNHLLTQSLLTKGTSSTRGRAITNELKAVAFATGSRNGGPAHEFTNTSTVGSHYYLPAVDSIFDKGTAETFNNISDNIAKNTEKATEEAKNFIDKLERWYNWLQEIAHLEKEINIEEAKRTRYASDMIPHGKEYFTSLIKSLEALNQQLAVQKDLNKERSKYFETLRAELNQGAFSILYEFDENFLPKYKEGMYEFMSGLLEADWYATGAPNNNAKSIYNQLVNMGFDSMMQYDTSGNKINKEKEGWENQAVQAFVERYKKGLEEGQKYHDDLMEGELKVEELIDAENLILKEIEDNLISVELKVLKALEDHEQRRIDDAQEERDTIEKSANDLIDGLNTQLENERNMYDSLDEADELEKLQRQLAIALRSGGSAATIADLQEQISNKQRDIYFDTQLKLIDALQEASDNELERLDHQIDLMQETLDYLKENGLLWNLVAEILRGSPNEIAQYIKDNTIEYWGQSTTELAKTLREDLFEIERFKLFLETADASFDVLSKIYGTTEEGKAENKKKEEEELLKKEALAATLGSGGGSGSNNSKKSGANGNKDYYEYQDDFTHWHEIRDKDGNTVSGTVEMHTFKNNVCTKCKGKKSEGWTKELAEQTQEELDDFNNGNNANLNANLLKSILGLTSGVIAANNIANGIAKIMSTVRLSAELSILGASLFKTVQQKASGGYVGHGLYELGERGTETVLTAEQTKILRDNILSNRPDSLISLLKSYNEAYHGLSQATYDSIADNSNITTIERAEVNLLIEKLADDYDSKRAANTIMDEMLRIASKTSANNSVRR